MGRLLCAVVALLAFGASPAFAAGIALEPSRVDATVQRGGQMPAIRVSNTTRQAVTVVAQPYPASQALSGMPEYATTRAARARGDRLLAVSPRRFTLSPGASRRVSAKVLACPQSGLGTYGVMDFRIQPVGARAAGGVGAALRLVAPLLLRYPPRACHDAEVASLRAEQVGRGRIAFFADVRNTGNVHARPRTTLELRRGGATVFRARFAPENVLPQAVREFSVPLTTSLPAGTYQAFAHTSGRAAPLERTIRLTDTNTLPTPRLALRDVAVHGTEPGTAPTVTGVVASTGTAAARGTVRLTLQRSGGGAAVETRTLDLPALAAGARHSFSSQLRALPAGGWGVDVDVSLDGRRVGHEALTFTVKPGAPASARWRDWAATHIDVLLGAMAGLLVLFTFAAAFLAARRRRRPRATADELAEIRAALARLEADAG